MLAHCAAEGSGNRALFCMECAMPRQAIPLPPQSVLLEAFIYDPLTGAIKWRGSGKVATSASGNRYLNVSFGGKVYLAHRVAWAITHSDPGAAQQVDHINGDKRDNRIANLRLASIHSNRWNSATRKDSGTGHKGIRFDGASYRARIHRGGVCRFDRKFKSLSAAIAAYEKAVIRIDGFYANAGDFAERGDVVKAVASSFAKWRRNRWDNQFHRSMAMHELRRVRGARHPDSRFLVRQSASFLRPTRARYGNPHIANIEADGDY